MPLVLTAGLGGYFLYTSKKKEGFSSIVKQPVQQSLGGTFTQFVEASASKFNPLVNLIDPLSNPFSSGNSVAQQTKIDATLKQALGSAIATPNGETMRILPSDTSTYTISHLQGSQGMEQIRACEKVRTATCDAFNDPKFAESCGICHEGGKDSGGNPVLGGLFILKDDIQTARESAARMGSNRVDYSPSVGQCAPGKFSVNKGQCQRIQKRLECEKKQGFDTEGCSQCFQDERFHFIDTDVTTTSPHIIIGGQGQIQYTILDANKKPVRVTKELSTTPIKIEVPYFKEGDILELNITGDSVYVGGYLEGKTASGTFTLDINRLLQTDLESGAKPRVTGFQMLNGIEVSTIRPAVGKQSMRLPIRNVFTFVETDQIESTYCSAAPFIQKSSSAEFLNSGPCYKKGQAPGKYSLECLQGLFLDAGCTVKGDKYPTDQTKAAELMRGPKGELLTNSQIAGSVYQMSQAAFSGQENGKRLTMPEWDEVSRSCTGKRIQNPCDGDAKATGPLSADCLAYLWQNQGATDTKPGALGPTYSGNTLKFCTSEGTMAPINSQGQYNQSAIAAANKAGGVDAVKALYNRIHAIANDNSQSDQTRKAALEQCYGLSLSALPTESTAGNEMVAGNIQSVLDYKPGRTKSELKRLNYTPMDWAAFSKPVAVLGPYGIAPWGTWWAIGFPQNTNAKWIWTHPSAAYDEPSWNSKQFFYRYTNPRKEPISLILIVAADNVASILINDALISNSTGNVTRVQVSFPPGENKIEINAANRGGPAGLCVVALQNSNPVFVSDSSWTTR